MSIFKRKNKTNVSIKDLKMLHEYNLPLTPFGDNIANSDVVMVCVDRIATQCAKLSARHIKVDENGVQTEKNGKLSFLLRHKPNELMSPYQFFYKLVSLLLLNDNAFVYPTYSRETLEIDGLYPINPIQVEPTEYQDGSHTFKFTFSDGKKYEIPIENIIHLKRFYTKDAYFGGNSFSGGHEALLKTVKINDSLLQSTEAAIKTSLQIKGILKINGMLRDEDKQSQLDEFTNAVKKAIKQETAIVPMDVKADYVPLATEPKLIDEPTLKFVQDKILEYFGVSDAIFNGKYTENEFNAFYESTIEPIAVQLSETFSLGLLTEAQLERGEEIIFFSERLQYASWQTKVGAIEKLMGLGIMSLNESRNLLGLEPIEGGDKRLQSLNYVDSSQANNYQVGKDDSNGNSDEKQNDDENQKGEL